MLLALFVVLALVTAACGGGEEAEDTTTTAASGDTTTTAAGPTIEGTLKVLVHQNPPMVAFMEDFNETFEGMYPDVEVEMSVVNTNELASITNARLTANDVDVIDVFGFSNGALPFMSDVDAPNWQQWIEAGLLLDLSNEDFINYYDDATLNDAGSFDGKVYSVNLGRVSYSGMFVNKDLLASVGVEIPTTWSELVSVCDAVTAAGNSCMTVGGADGWPVFVGQYGLLGAMFPDQEALVEGLWTGTTKWTDAQGVEYMKRVQTYATEMLEDGASSFAHDANPARYAAGDVAFMATGVWQAPALEAAEPAFDWTYIPFPGSDNPEDNQYLFGKYDQGWAIASDSPNKDAALAYLAAFSEPDNYEAFVNAVGFLPTQPTATLNTKLGQEVAPYLENYRVGFEQYWVAPKGAGDNSNGSTIPASNFFSGTFSDPVEAANLVQGDLQAGLDS
jgi:raffinose/stachyose/melibiose transport system substrate-binding protein